MLFYARGALHEALSCVTVTSAWLVTGLCPWCPRRVLDGNQRVSDSDLIPLPPPNPTATQRISGRVVTLELMRQFQLGNEVAQLKREVAKASKDLERGNENQTRSMSSCANG